MIDTTDYTNSTIQSTLSHTGQERIDKNSFRPSPHMIQCHWIFVHSKKNKNEINERVRRNKTLLTDDDFSLAFGNLSHSDRDLRIRNICLLNIQISLGLVLQNAYSISDIYLSDGSNGRPRLRLGGPRKPLPDFPFDNSTRARRPQMVRPSSPLTASSASLASSNSTNAKLFPTMGKQLIVLDVL